MKVSIIIPVFGPEHFLTACLKAITDNTEGDYEVVIADNATGYDMIDVPNLGAVIRNKENLGYAVANNNASKCAKGEVLCLLNVDAEVQPGWLPPLVAAFDESDVVMAGPRIEHFDHSLQTSGIRCWHGNGNAGGEEIKQDLGTRDVDGVTGACMVIRKSVFDDLGQFDTRFINGYEDVALCLSAREAGHRIRFVDESLVLHHESAAGGSTRWAHAAQNVATMNAVWGQR